MKKIFKWFSIALLLFALISLTVTKNVYDRQFPKVERHDESVTAKLRYDDIKDQYERSIVTFQSGKNTLTGYLYGHNHTDGLVIVSHGLGGGADSYIPQIKAFLDRGWRVLAYDATGSFDSEGSSTKGFPQAIMDLDAALKYVKATSELSEMPILLFGHSWGGYAAANMPHFDHDIKGIVSVSGANSAMDMIIEQGEHMMGSFIYVQKPFLWAYQQLLFGKLTSLEAVDAINKTDIPYLIIHGSEDEMVGIDESAVVAYKEKWTNPNVQTIIIDAKGRNDHNNLFRSSEALDYIDQINGEYKALYEKYNQNIPYALKQEFYAQLDRSRVNVLDQDLMDQIDQFYRQAIDPTMN